MRRSAAEREVAAALSSRVREWRLARRLSLDALARRSGIAKGTVVAIERQAANPSLRILCRLAAVLSLPVAALLEAAPPPGRAIERVAARTRWRTARGSEAVLLAASGERTTVELWSCRIARGDTFAAARGDTFAAARGDTFAAARGAGELVAVVRGQLRVTAGEETAILKPGEAARVAGDRRRRYAAAGRGAVALAMAVLEGGARP